MALLVSVARLSTRKIQLGGISDLVRHGSAWNKDWKPGPYPRTDAEKKAAAEKYGIPISEYKPYPDDGEGHGDYPKLPDKGIEGLDAYHDWDYPEHRRNLHDTLHVQADMYGPDRFWIDQKLRIGMRTQLMWFFGVLGGFFAVYGLFEYMPMFRPVLPKQYPTEGETHYSFDLK